MLLLNEETHKLNGILEAGALKIASFFSFIYYKKKHFVKFSKDQQTS